MPPLYFFTVKRVTYFINLVINFFIKLNNLFEGTQTLVNKIKKNSIKASR